METAYKKITDVIERIYGDDLLLYPKQTLLDKLFKRRTLQIYCQAGFSKKGHLLYGIFIGPEDFESDEEQILCVNDKPITKSGITRVHCKDPRYEFIADDLAKAFGLKGFHTDYSVV